MASYQPYGELSIYEISSLSIENAKSILREVNQLIYQHDIAYHQKDTPVISTLFPALLLVEFVPPNFNAKPSKGVPGVK